MSCRLSCENPIKLMPRVVNRKMLTAALPNGSSPTTMLVLARRPLNATSGEFLPFMEDSQVVHEINEDRIVITGLTQFDGQWLILITPPKDLTCESWNLVNGGSTDMDQYNQTQLNSRCQQCQTLYNHDPFRQQSLNQHKRPLFTCPCLLCRLRVR